MKLHAKYIKRLYNEQHHSEISFLIENYSHQRYVEELDTSKQYSIEIKEVKSKRSQQSNKYLWALIRALSLKTREDDLDLYTKLLDSANAKFTYIVTVDNAENILKSSFRVVKKIEKRDIVDKDKVTEGWMYKCYFGSSKFTIAEMQVLLETLIVWCINEGIETEDYR